MSTAHIVFGPQGAGKTTYSMKLADELNGVHFSIDNWMWNLFGDDMPKSLNLKWINERISRCESQIWSIAQSIVKSETDVILDLGFTKYSKREKFRKLCSDLNLELTVHYLKAPLGTRRKRVLDRNINKGKTFSFEVSPGMFDFMESEFELPISYELNEAIIIETD